MSEKTLKELLEELINSLDYFRLMINIDEITKRLKSIDEKLEIIVEALREKKGYMEAEIKTLEGDKNET